jgi:hypothetical protein
MDCLLAMISSLLELLSRSQNEIKRLTRAGITITDKARTIRFKKTIDVLCLDYHFR